VSGAERPAVVIAHRCGHSRSYVVVPTKTAIALLGEAAAHQAETATLRAELAPLQCLKCDLEAPKGASHEPL
jgi:hypothetical protein